MIHNKEQLNEFILADAAASGRRHISASFFGDEIWKFQLAMRNLDYYQTNRKKGLNCIGYFYWKFRYHQLSVKLGFSIPHNVCNKGLSLPHYGCIVINNASKIGENCRILDGVNIGATNGSRLAPQIGNRVFIGSGAKIMGNITIADDVAIGANAVVVKSITEPSTTWAGVPARKISNHSSHSNLPYIK